jgi:hypothetical protein
LLPITLHDTNDPIYQFLTAYLTLTVLMLAAEKSKDTFIAPIGIGLVLFSICLADVNYSGASFNPARSIAPCIVAASFPGYHWIHWLGPILGATLAAGCYHCIKVSGLESITWDIANYVCLHSSSITRMSMATKTALVMATASISSKTYEPLSNYRWKFQQTNVCQVRDRRTQRRFRAHIVTQRSSDSSHIA